MKVLTFVLFTFFMNPTDTELMKNATFDLSGLVVEEGTGEPLTGALIKIKELEKEYYTDFEGRFSINELIPGRYNIEVSYISYESAKLEEIQLDRRNNDLLVGLR